MRLGYCFKSERRFTPSPTHCQGVFSHFSGDPQKSCSKPPAPARKASPQHTGFIQKSLSTPEGGPFFKSPNNQTEDVDKGLLEPDTCPCPGDSHTKKHRLRLSLTDGSLPIRPCNGSQNKPKFSAEIYPDTRSHKKDPSGPSGGQTLETFLRRFFQIATCRRRAEQLP